jgi:hypothetical protein
VSIISLTHLFLQHLQTLVILEQCLQRQDKIDREAVDTEYAQKHLIWLSEVIKPVGDILIQDNDSESHKLLERLSLMSKIALKCIRHLQTHFIPQGDQVDSRVLLSILAYTDAEDPWTSGAVQEAAEEVLSYHQKQLISHEFIIEHVLIGFIRPLFSESQPASVTSQGRKAINHTIQRPDHLRDLDASKKPWKCREVSAMAVLRWGVRNMEVINLSRNQ